MKMAQLFNMKEQLCLVFGRRGVCWIIGGALSDLT